MRILLVLLLVTVAPAAHADPVASAQAFFTDFTKRTNDFDPGVAALYSDTARIITLRDGVKRMEMPGSQWKALLVKVMPIAKKRGDTSTFDDVEVSAHGDGYRVTATRFPAVKCVPDENYHLDIETSGDSWTIIEEYAETVSLSQCKPSKKLAGELTAVSRGIQPHLPMDLDDDTRLESVEVVGPALIYRQRLHSVRAADLDPEQVVAILRQLGFRYACGAPETKALIAQGATIRYTTIDQDDAVLAVVDIAPGMCP